MVGALDGLNFSIHHRLYSTALVALIWSPKVRAMYSGSLAVTSSPRILASTCWTWLGSSMSPCLIHFKVAGRLGDHQPLCGAVGQFDQQVTATGARLR